MLIKDQSRHHSFPSNAQHIYQQDASQRSAAVSHLNIDGETKCNSKHVKSTIYCIGLFILFHSDVHPKLS